MVQLGFICIESKTKYDNFDYDQQQTDISVTLFRWNGMDNIVEKLFSQRTSILFYFMVALLQVAKNASFVSVRMIKAQSGHVNMPSLVV